MSEYIPKYPSQEGDDSNKSSSELLAETLKPIYVPQELMLAWESHLAGYSRDTHVLLDQVKDSETALNTQYQALLARVQKYEQMLQDITMDSNEFLMDSDEENFTGWNILAQASYWDYLLKKEITKLSDLIKSADFRGGLVSEVTDEILEGLIADNNYISNVIEALSDTPLIRELADALNTTTISLADLQAEYVSLMQKQAADAEALANQQVENAEQLIEAINAAIAEQLDRIAQEAAIRTQLLQELEDRVNDASAQAEADVAELTAQVDSIREGSAADKASILETVNNYKTELKSDIATVNTELLGALDGVNTLVTEVRDENGVTLNELTTYKASNDVALAGVLSKVTTNISDTAANASKIAGLTTELATTNTELGTVRNTSANALNKANTAVTANSALATRVDSLAAAITDLGEGAETHVDVYAFNALKAEVVTNASGVSSLVEQVNSLGTEYTNLADGVQANTDAVSTLTTKQSEMNGDISQLSSDVTFLTSELGVTNTALNTKASNQALSNLNTKLTTTDGKVAANTQQLTQLNTDLTTVRNGLETKASTEALNNLATEVTELEGGLAVNASAITSLKSEINTELNKKATVTAVNGLTTKVNEVEGKTTTNANNILALNTSVGNVVNGLANKLDASAISDYYTKSQTDDKVESVAAGKVEEFSASLSIGLDNLLPTQIKLWENGYWATSSGAAVSDPVCSRTKADVRIPVTAGEKYSLRSNTRTVLVFYSAENTRTGFHESGTITPPTTAQVITIPANSTYARAYLFGASGVVIKPVPFDQAALVGLQGMLVKGTHTKLVWQHSALGTSSQIDANSTAITNTNTEVARVDGRVTTESNRTTTLTGRVSTVEGDISKKADASALSSLDTRVGSVEGKYTSQASDITRLNNSLDTTNANVGTAQTAAQNAMNAAGAKGKVIFGTTAPAVADRLVQNLWIDTTGNANTPKRWNGSAWVVVTDKVATDAANAVSALDATVKTKADVSALNSLTTKVTDEAGKTTANTNSITILNSDIVKINNDLATKANASALSDMYTKTQADDKATEIAAGELAKYDANLVIGGTNLQPGTQGGNFTPYNGQSFIEKDGEFKTKIVRFEKSVSGARGIAMSASTHKVALNKGNKYLLSFYVKGTLPLNYVYLMASTSAGANSALTAVDLSKVNDTAFTKVVFPFTATADRNNASVMLASNGPETGWLEIAEIMFQEGTKSTPWEPSYLDTQASLDTNATAIQTTNAEVSRVDGRVTTESNRITSLTGRVSTVEGAVSTKADASALNSLTTRVATEEGKSTSQGSAITALQNTINHATTGLSTKASSAALTAVDNKVTAVDGRVTATNSNVAALTGRVSTVEGGLSTKADVSAINALTTRVGDVEGGLSTQANNTLSLSAKIDSRADSASLIPDYLLRNKDEWRSHYGLDLTPYFRTVTDGKNGNTVFRKPADVSACWNYSRTALPNDRVYKLSMWVRRAEGSAGSVFFTCNLIGIDGVHATANTYVGVAVPTTNVWTYVEQVWNLTGSKDTNPQLAFGFALNHATAGAIAEMQGFKVEAVISIADTDSSLASADALSTTNTEVSRVNGVVSGHTTQLSNLTTSITGKADSSALNALTVRVKAEEGKSSSQSTSITNLNSSVDDALKAVTVSDTRSTNQPPSWYWSNYTRRVVNEFKTQTVIGVGGFFGGTYCNLETKVYYSDPSGGDIIQTATSSVDPSLYVQRRSNGTAAWTAWEQPIKDLRDSLGTKASASAVSTLDTKVENIDGKVTTQASQILTLTSDNDVNKNALQVQAKVVDGVKANYMVKMETNGVIGGFGLMQSTGVLGQVSTSFGVNADSFFIGAPVGGKKPFMVTTANQVVDGITYPAGTWINTAIIANATIGTAHIANASITNAKIANIDAAKITTGTLDAGRIRVGGSTQFDTGFAPSDVLNNAKTYVDAVEIGSRNLVKDSALIQFKGSDTGNGGASVVVDDLVRLTPVAAGNVWGSDASNGGLVTASELLAGEQYTFSVMVKTAMTSIGLYCYSGGNHLIYNTPLKSGNVWERVSFTFTQSTTRAKNFTFLAGFHQLQAGVVVEYRSFKLEKGNKATDWTPAPEDVDTAIEAKTQTFIAQPTTPYAKGDIWKDGTTIKVCTVTRASGSYTAADWTLVGDVTSANTAANSLQLGGIAAATVTANAQAGKTLSDNIMSDLIITPVEKSGLLNEWNRIKSEYTNLNSQAVSLGVSAAALTTAYTALNVTAPRIETDILASMVTNYTLTTATRDALKTQLNTYFVQAMALSKALTDKVQANAAAAQGTANTANNQVNTWKFTGTTEIDGGKIRADSITANQISVANLSLISGNLGTIQVGTANIAEGAISTAKIGDLQVDTIKVKDNAITNGIASQDSTSLTIVTNGGQVRINVGITHYASSTTYKFTNTLILYRDGIELKRWTFTGYWNSVDYKWEILLNQELPMVVDIVGAGTHIYSLNGLGTTSLALLEVKK